MKTVKSSAAGHVLNSMCEVVFVCSTWYLLDHHLAEVADDVWQQVSPWVSDLVYQLLSDSAKGNEAAGFGRFGENEGAVAGTFDHRETHVVPETQIKGQALTFYWNCFRF